jgi:hypothetical protein
MAKKSTLSDCPNGKCALEKPTPGERCTPCERAAAVKIGNQFCEEAQASNPNFNTQLPLPCDQLFNQAKREQISAQQYVQQIMVAPDLQKNPEFQAFLKELKEAEILP